MDQFSNRRLAATEAASADVDGSPRSQAVAGLAVGVFFMGSTLLTPLYDLYRSAYGFSAVVLVLLYAVYVIGNLTVLLLLGRLSDQIGRRPVVYAGLALAALSSGLFLAARDPAWLFAGRIVNGLAVGLGAGAATAWLTESTPRARRPHAAILMTSCNLVGLAAGPALTGMLVQYAPAPLHLTFWVYLALLAATALPASLARETVGPRRAPIVLKPRLGVPPQIRLAFIAPALTAFAAMAVVGFYAALGPTLMRRDLHIDNRALGGLAVAELFVVGAAAIVATRRLSARTAMLAGMGLAPVGLALLAAAQRLESLPLLLTGTAVCGVCAALGYRGSLQVVNALAPADRKAEVVSVYFACGFMGNALPVIGVGVLSQAAGARLADTVFAGVISVAALGALVADLAFGGGGRRGPKGA